MKKLLLTTALASLAFATAAHATTWTVWSPTYTAGYPGSATGTMDGVTVSYAGEVNGSIGNPPCGGVCFGYPSWNPTSTWVGGIVTSAPAPDDGMIQLIGGGGTGAITDTIVFSSPVLNPVIAIWSLGQGGGEAEFDFSTAPTFEAGGPSAEYGGVPVVVSGSITSGYEGNGSVAFLGTYSSISFTNPNSEDWYGFTVGSAVPEPSTWAMMTLGFAGLGFAAFRRKAGSRLAIA